MIHSCRRCFTDLVLPNSLIPPQGHRSRSARQSRFYPGGSTSKRPQAASNRRSQLLPHRTPPREWHTAALAVPKGGHVQTAGTRLPRFATLHNRRSNRAANIPSYIISLLGTVQVLFRSSGQNKNKSVLDNMHNYTRFSDGEPDHDPCQYACDLKSKRSMIK